MAAAQSPFEKAVFDSEQLALKLCMNSFYGVMGASKGYLRCKPAAAAITATGRNMILETKAFVEDTYGAEVIYGDSVAAYTPITIRRCGQVEIIAINTLQTISGHQWDVRGDGKRVCRVTDIEAWSEGGWTPIQEVIMHALAPRKQMVRVLTQTGLVDVTSDHSLIRGDGKAVSPMELSLDVDLLHAPVPLPLVYDAAGPSEEDEARIMGFFMGGGVCGSYSSDNSQIKSFWALGHVDPSLLCHYKLRCAAVYPAFTWTILNPQGASNSYRLVPSGTITAFVRKYRAHAYSGECKRVPTAIINGPYACRAAFWEGALDADGDQGPTHIGPQDQLTAAGLYVLATSLGLAATIGTRSDTNAVRLNLTRGHGVAGGHGVKKVEVVPNLGDVYDLTTENHHFQAGVGSLIVHNTDSIFVKLPNHQHLSFPELFGVGEEIAERASALFPDPVALTFEKVYMPLLLYGKKHYTGMKYESSSGQGKRDVKGLACVRKDTCPFIRAVMLEVIDHLLRFDNTRAIQAAEVSARRLLMGDVALEEMVMSSQLGEKYASDNLAHVRVAQLMRSRGAGAAPQVGDRVEYVWVERGNRNSKGYERAEDPGYVRHQDAPIDYLEYFERQLNVKLQDLFRGTDTADQLFQSDTVRGLLETRRTARQAQHREWKAAEDAAALKRTGQRTVLAYFGHK